MCGEYYFDAEKVRQELFSRGWSAYRLAKEAGIGAERVRRVVEGIGQPGLDTLFTIADALGMDVNDLVKVRPRPSKEPKPIWTNRKARAERIHGNERD